MLIYRSLMPTAGFGDALEVIGNGLRLDFAVAGYLTALPALMLIISIWMKKGSKAMAVLGKIWNIYFWIAAFCYVLAIAANLALYAFWGFPLDSTPLFYLLTSPADAFASISIWLLLLAILGIIALTSGICWCIHKFLSLNRLPSVTPIKNALCGSIIMLLLLGALIIPIRGGFTVAVNNVSSVYFSNDIRLNHAAVNPLFSFLESATHAENFAQQYRFMSDEEATELFNKLTYTMLRDNAQTDSLLTSDFRQALSDKEKDVRVIFVILESFSSYIMEDHGNVKGVVPNIDKLSREGIFFTNFYANSFRTDRGLMSILSGYPAQPTASLSKYPKKTNDLFAISRSVKKAGFSTDYIYGGDANFTNMRSWLAASGYENIIDEKDFPADLERGKWGVDDGPVFDRSLEELSQPRNTKHRFMVVQTSSSHEPFQVPYHKLENERLNAFQYADRELGRFIETLRKAPEWGHTLLVIVPDHLGCYPENIDNYQLYRYQIPLILAGGAVEKPLKVSTIASQQDISATLLAMLGIDHSDFIFSKDIFDNRAPHFAFFTVPDAIGMVTNSNQVIYDNVAGRAVLDKGEKKGHNLRMAQAYLQKIYDDIASR